MEHKTSRLYEDRAHVASVKTGNNKIIQLVSTSPNEVAIHLKYLHQEMQRRDGLSGQELARQPIILIYIEELLALQYEVDPKLLQIIFQSLLLLAIRARKLGMFLLAAMQTDYSTEEMKINQKMFRFRGAAGVDTSAARAAGFQNTELIKLNFQYGKAGQFVVEYPGFSNLVLTAFYDVEKMLGEKFGFVPGFGQALYDEIAAQPPSLKSGRNGPETSQKPLEMPDETTRQAKGALVRDLLSKNWGKVKIIEKIWGAKAGASKAYKAAEAEYEQIVTEIEAEKVSA